MIRERCRLATGYSTPSQSWLPMNYSETPFSFRIFQIFQGAIGISMCLTPKCDRASTTAFTKAAGDPTFGDSPTPLAPNGWWGDGVQVLPVSQFGVSTAVGTR